MNCPNCGYFNDVGIQAAVKINDKDGHPINPPTRYDCRRCGHIYNSDDATRWKTPRASLFNEVLRLLHSNPSKQLFHIMRVPDVARESDKELVKISVDGLDGAAFIISSVDQLHDVVFLAEKWLMLRASEQS